MDERFMAVLFVAGVAMAVAAQVGLVVLERPVAPGGGGEGCWRIVVNGSAAHVYGYPVPWCFHDDAVVWALGNYNVVVLTGVFRIRGHHELVLRNRVLRGDGAVIEYAAPMATIGVVDSYNVSFIGLVVRGRLDRYGVAQPGLWARNSSRVYFINNTVAYGSYGIAVLYGSRYAVIAHNVLGGFIDDAITVTNSSYAWVYGNVVYGLGVGEKTVCASGIEADAGSHHVYIYNNTVWSYMNTGIHVHYHRWEAAPHDIVIAGNTVYLPGHDTHGIGVQGIYVKRPVRNIVVANNTVYATGYYGLIIEVVVNATITGNRVLNTTTYIDAVINATITHNIFYDYYILRSKGIHSTNNTILRNNTKA